MDNAHDAQDMQKHIHTPSYPRKGRWSRFWDLLLHSWRYDKETMTAKCSICGKLIEPAMKPRSCLIIVLVSSLYVFWITGTLSYGTSMFWPLILTEAVTAILLVFMLPTFLMAFLPWNEVPSDTKAYLEQQEKANQRLGNIVFAIIGIGMILFLIVNRIKG